MTLADGSHAAEIFYLTALPMALSRPLLRALQHDEYPPGTAPMAGRALLSGWLVGAGLYRKRATLDRLAEKPRCPERGGARDRHRRRGVGQPAAAASRSSRPSWAMTSRRSQVIR